MIKLIQIYNTLRIYEYASKGEAHQTSSTQVPHLDRQARFRICAIRLSTAANHGESENLLRERGRAAVLGDERAIHLGVAQNLTAGVTQVFVYFSIYQGSILDRVF